MLLTPERISTLLKCKSFSPCVKGQLIFIASHLNQRGIVETFILECVFFHLCRLYSVTPWLSSLFGPRCFGSLLEQPGCSFREFLPQRGIMLRTSLCPAGLCVCVCILQCSSLMAKKEDGQVAQVCVYVCRRGDTLWTSSIKTFSDDWSLERITNSSPLVWQMSPLDKCFRNSLITRAHRVIM